MLLLTPQINGNKLKKYEEIWKKIKNVFALKINNSGD